MNTSTQFTPNSALDLLFSAELIPAEVQSLLPSNLHVRSGRVFAIFQPNFSQIRPLASSDYQRGHLSVLNVLTAVPDPGEVAWVAQFKAIRDVPHTYYSIVIVNKDTDTIVALGTVFIERKFIRGLGSAGHIEDIAVDKSQQGKKLGLRIIQALTSISENSGCYKTILNCSQDNIRELHVSGEGRPDAEDFHSVLRKMWVPAERM